MFAPVRMPVRALLFGIWLVLVAWLASQHVQWRDEARAFALATSGETWIDMFRAMHGDGHPVLWYIILRALHDIVPVKEVLPAAGLAIGIAVAAVVAFRAPFRLPILVLVLFSGFLLFHHTVVARNYGLASLILFPIAAAWPRLRDSLWLGVLLFLLCNTAVPTVILAGGIFLYRALSLWEEQGFAWTPALRRLLANGLLLGAGALTCFLAVYPTPNDAAAALAGQPFSLATLVEGLVRPNRSLNYTANVAGGGVILTFLSLLLFVRHRPALVAALVTLLLFRSFFTFVYPASYRHSAQFIVFLIALLWIVHRDNPSPEESRNRFQRLALQTGQVAFVLLLAFQILYSARMIQFALADIPFSRAADLVRVMEREGVGHAVVMGQPDTWVEAVAYQLGRPVWLIRQSRFGTVSPLSFQARKQLTLSEMVDEAELVHRRTGKPVVLLLYRGSRNFRLPVTLDTAFGDYLTLDEEGFAKLDRQTRRIASFDRAVSDESYNVYLYPR